MLHNGSIDKNSQPEIKWEPDIPDLLKMVKWVEIQMGPIGSAEPENIFETIVYQ